MITREEGRKFVDTYLASRLPPHEYGPRVVWDEHTEDHPGCWIFYWVLQKYLETKDRQYRLGGNYPILVDKTDGSLYATGPRDADEYVALFNADKFQLQRLMPS